MTRSVWKSPARGAALLFLLCSTLPAFATTVSGTVKDAAGNPLASGKILLTLSQEATAADPALILALTVSCSIANGQIQSCTVRGNETLSPAGTYYKVRIVTPAGDDLLPSRNYVISGTTWDLGTATPLATATVAATAYQIVQDEGANVPQRQKLNLTGAGVTCADDSANARTNCTITGGGAGSTHQIDGTNLAAQDPINFQDTTEIDWTNPAAGNLQAALKAESVLPSKINDGGVASTQALFSGGAGAPAFRTLTDADVPDTVTLTDLTQITTRNYSALQNRTHLLADTAGLGPDHSASGLTAGYVLRATGAATAAFAQLNFADLAGSAARGQLPAAIVYDDEANTYSAFKQDFGAATVEIPNATALPGTCVVGEIFHDTDATPTENRLFLCTAANTWTAVGNPFGSTIDAAELSAGFLDAVGDIASTLCTDGQVLKKVTGAWACAADEAGGGSNHNLLSATHSDTTAGTVARGDLVVGQSATPSWQRLALGVSGRYLRSDGTDLAYSAVAAAGVGSCTNQFPRTLNDNAAPTCADVAPADFASQIANTVLAAPDGSAGEPTFRTLVEGDIPSAITRDSAWPSATATLTNKTYDAEGTGNIVTTVSKLYFVAGGCNNATAGPGWDIPTSNGPTATCFGTSPHRFGGLDFADGASALTSTLNFHLPSDWTSTGGVDVKTLWFCSAGTCTTNNFVATFATVCVADAEGLAAPTYNTPQTRTIAGSATQNNRLSDTLTGLTMTGCAAGESFFLRVGRDPTNASDTQAGTMTLLGAEITLRRAQ